MVLFSLEISLLNRVPYIKGVSRLESVLLYADKYAKAKSREGKIVR